jgi:hypothetical protein
MSFPLDAAPCVIRPEQFETIKHVYELVTAEEWFTPSSKRREQFAAYLMEAYRNGLTDPFELRTLGRAAARERFAIH